MIGEEKQSGKRQNLVGMGSLFLLLLSACLFSYFSQKDGGRNIFIFWGLYAIQWLFYLLLYKSFPGLTKGIQLAVLLISFLGMRLIYSYSTPIYEDDFNRYLWDGYVLSAGGNPYQVAPMEFFGEPETEKEVAAVLDGINNPHLPTIYGPFAEFLFYVSYKAGGGELYGLLIVLASFDLVIGFVFLWQRKWGSLYIYGACPFLLLEVWTHMHLDIIGASLLFLAFQLVIRYPKAGLFLASIATAVKVMSLPFLPFLFRKWKLWHIFLFILIIGLFYYPFTLSGNYFNLFYSLRVMMGEWMYNSLFYRLFPELYSEIKYVMMFILGVYFVFLYRIYNQQKLPVDEVLILFFFPVVLLSPVVNPWYFLWIFPFVCRTLKMIPLLIIFMTSISYLNDMNLGVAGGGYDHPWAVLLIEYSVILYLAIRYSSPIFMKIPKSSKEVCYEK